MIRSLKYVFLVMIVFLPTPALAGEKCTPSEDVLTSLQCIDGMTVEEVTVPPSSHRIFELRFTQPLDHNNPEAGTFAQRLVLHHRGWQEPMVLQTSGYSIFATMLSRLASSFDTNQLQVEHRFFGDSVPEDKDLSKLNIRQSAADFHRIVEALKPLYSKPWVGTGASKGGMTSVYHRRFYPDDLAGTVADVAPLSFSKDDERYVDFVDNVGGKDYEGCRAKLVALQTALLLHRDEIVARATGPHTVLGEASVAFEHAVIELPFIFWQYQKPADASAGCQAIPKADASADALFAYMSLVNSIDNYADKGLEPFMSYYFQAGTELGGPAAKVAHLGDNIQHEYSIDQYMPRGESYDYSNAEMRDVEVWVKSSGEGIMFIYGEFDPWTAGAFPRIGVRDQHFFVVPGGNHGANFTRLPGGLRQEAVAVLSRWLGKNLTKIVDEQEQLVLDDIEFEMRRRARLP